MIRVIDAQRCTVRKEKAGENKAKSRGARQLKGKGKGPGKGKGKGKGNGNGNGNGKDGDTEVKLWQHKAHGTRPTACCDTA